jgi:hypothetical protein
MAKAFTWGGAREGAGRKKSYATQLREIALAEHDSEARKSMAVLIYLRDHARGEGIRMAAAIEIKNTVWGKPRQALEHSGPKGGPIETKGDIPNLGGIPTSVLEAALKKLVGGVAK